MRTSERPVCASLFSILLLPAIVSAATTIDCKHVRANRKGFNLSPLSGPHQVMLTEKDGESTKYTTYTIDLCSPLGKVAGQPSQHQCPSGTRVCGIEKTRSGIDNETIFDWVKPIAGDIGNYGGSAHGLDPSWTLLSESEAASDAGKEGLRLTLKGGKYPLKKTGDQAPKDQQAIVELICDKERTGLEGEMDPEDKYESETVSAKADDADTPAGPSLTFVSYPGTNDKIDTLQLNWKTKYACEDTKDETDAEQKSSWGFFTWFFFIAFLGTAAYLIFGSWLNYTRYGARGWDLLPHGDTIRDVPYLMKDWTRKVVSTVQGGGSRGGYAAV